MKKIYIDSLIKMNIIPTQQNLDKLTIKQLYMFNELNQKKIGQEQYDYLTLNEFSADTKKVFEFNTLKDWDFDDWEFQKAHETTVSESYDRLYMPGIWFRALEKSYISGKRQLTYGQLESARSYCYRKVIEKLENKLNKKIPFMFSKSYGESLFSNNNLNQYEKRCGGKEVERKILEDKLRSLNHLIEEDILLMLKPYEGYAFREVSDRPIYDHLDYFIIGGFTAAEKISFKTFFKDFYDLEQPIEILKNLIKDVYKKYKKDIFI